MIYFSYREHFVPALAIVIIPHAEEKCKEEIVMSYPEEKRAALRARIYKNVTQIWLLHQLSVAGVKASKSHFSEYLSGKRTGSAAETVLAATEKILDRFEEGNLGSAVVTSLVSIPSAKLPVYVVREPKGSVQYYWRKGNSFGPMLTQEEVQIYNKEILECELRQL